MVSYVELVINTPSTDSSVASDKMLLFLYQTIVGGGYPVELQENVTSSPAAIVTLSSVLSIKTGGTT